MKKEIRELNAPAIDLIADILDKHVSTILGEVKIRFKQIKAGKLTELEGQHPNDAAVDAFAAAMKAKLKRAREEKGRGGWQDMSAAELSAMLREHIEKGDPIDVANFAMMLHQNGQRIEPAKKKPYAQGSALSEFGVIPLCDQVDND